MSDVMFSEATETIYNFIRDFIAERKISPTLREIAQGCYLAHSTVIRHLDKLEGAGRITREPSKARSIILLN
jgi:DNA-binding MarR family transcriptional regulator